MDRKWWLGGGGEGGGGSHITLWETAQDKSCELAFPGLTVTTAKLQSCWHPRGTGVTPWFFLQVGNS